jgi:hypothetical protein
MLSRDELNELESITIRLDEITSGLETKLEFADFEDFEENEEMQERLERWQELASALRNAHSELETTEFPED